jgi:hypothetical protein
MSYSFTDDCFTTNDAPHPTLDLIAIIVTRCWDAAGMRTVLIERCEFKVDIPVVNIGANAVSNVNFVSSRVDSISRTKSVVHVYALSRRIAGDLGKVMHA